MTRLGAFWPITATVPMVTVVIVAAVAVALVIGSHVATASWAMSARILVEAYFDLFGVGVLIGGRDHLANPVWRLTIEFGAEVAVMESSDEGGDDFCFRGVGNRIPHLEKLSDVTTEELGQFLIDAIQIVLGARSSTHSHIIVGEDFFQLFPGSGGVWGKACEPVHGGWREHDGKIIHHDTDISPDGSHSYGISL